MSDKVPDGIMAMARAIYDNAQEFNGMTWHGPLRDELREVVDYVWQRARNEGYLLEHEDSR